MNDNTSDNRKEGLKKHLILYAIEAFFLLVAITGFIFVSRATRIKRVEVDDSNVMVNDDVLEESKGSSGHLFDADSDAVEDKEDPETEKLKEKIYDKYNGSFDIAFFGVDSREDNLGAGTRSDSIMICHIDMETHEVKLVSIYRDTYLNLGDDTYNKCNAAYAKGGPERALSMINKNTDLYITDYVTVGFTGLIGVIDALDGVTIDVKEDEIFHLNNYQISMADQMGIDYTPVVYAGYQSLNGLQATAYCRIRATAGDDFKRAERQRTVVAAMLEKSKQVKIGVLTDALGALFPYIQTSLSIEDIASMIKISSDYKVTVSEGFPFRDKLNGGTMGTVGAFIVPVDLTDNVKELHLVFFNDEDYEPSADVRSFSDRIKNDTKDYLSY